MNPQQGGYPAKAWIHFDSRVSWERGDGVPDASDLIKLSELFKVPTDYILFDDVPRDGKIDIKDIDLLNLFEAASQLDEKKRETVKDFLKAFIFREKMAEEFTAVKR